MRILPVLLLLLAALPAQDEAPEPLGEDERILHALSRLTFGPRPGDVERVREIGLDAWIAAQFTPGRVPESQDLVARLSGYTTLGMTPKQVYDLAAKEEDRRMRRRARREPLRELREAIVLRACLSNRQLHEVLADFWRNHFNVDAAKGASVPECLTHYEHEVIRRHALGSFSELLDATARHPAMLIYLDNYLSRKAPPKAELRRIEREVRRRTGSRERARQQAEIAEQRGLNENYARELMELHTLGVDNGYTQQDVVHVAKAFTGWTVSRKDNDVKFCFGEGMHDTSRKRLMGRPLPRGRRESGITEGEAVLERLARHPNTAGFIARKLCVRLVDDRPPEEIVEAAAGTFRKTKGDLRETVKAIVEHPRFFDRRHYQAKFKTPLEFVVSAVRATNAEITKPDRLVRTIAEKSMPIYNCEDPTGYYDTTEAWRDPGVMAHRWKFAIDLAHDRVAGVRIPASFYEGLPEDPLEIPLALAKKIIPQGLGPHTSRVLERVLFRAVQRAGAEGGIEPMKLARLYTGILLGSPEFQQQ